MKKIASFLMAIILTIIPINIAFANDENTALNLASKSAVLMDVSTGQVLYEKNSNNLMYPASTTKILTAILVLENYHQIVLLK